VKGIEYSVPRDELVILFMNLVAGPVRGTRRR